MKKNIKYLLADNPKFQEFLRSKAEELECILKDQWDKVEIDVKFDFEEKDK